MTFNYNYVSTICSSNERLPLEIRTDKNIAKNFINFIKENSIIVKNEFISILSNWCDRENESTFSKIISIDYMGKNQTFDMEIEDAHSYKANGIFAHNTINLPEHTTEETVEQVLLAAWKSGCKGVTVYRDKCRSGVLVSNEENKINIFKENHAPKRPKTLKCEVLRFNNNKEKWTCFLGLYDHKPYEIFTGLSEMVAIPFYVTQGEIVKEKLDDQTNIYNFKYIDKDGYSQEFKGLSRAFNREYYNAARLFSGLLRHGMPLPNLLQLIDRLEIEESSTISNWKSGVKRAIKKYIKDGTKINSSEKCIECGSNELVFKEGCISCASCGWSKCS